MNTKLSRLMEAIIEAGWLAALVIVPLFFNVHSSRVFEPDKLSLLRSIALVMAVAWIVKFLNDGFGDRSTGQDEGESRPSLWQRIKGTPLVLPTLFLMLAYLISTVFSLTPRISWWGSYQRLQGTYTTYSYIIIFFLVLGHLRRPEQWRRIAYVIILTSLPICIYGFLQKTGQDPLPWGGDVQRRIAANMGNAIFVAAYLLMASFLTLQRLLVHFSRLLKDQGGRLGIADGVLGGVYLFILVVQFITLIYTQSRGPLLGLLAGLYVFGLVGLLGLRTWAKGTTRLRWWLRGVLQWAWLAPMVIAALVIGFLVVFNLPSSPLAALRTNPYIGRLGTALDFQSNTARVRTLIWQGVTEMIGPHEPLQSPVTGGQGDVTAMRPDPFNAIRPLIGYGPEGMWVAFNRFYPPDLAHHESRNASPDRSHNETFDALGFTGIIGFIAYMTLFLSVFYYCLKWLGLIRGGRQRAAFLILAIAGGALGATIPYLLRGNWVLLGIGLPAGLILGIILYVTAAAIWNERQGLPMRLGQRELVIMTILATMAAHFIEIHFGIAIAATRTYFWVWSAVLVVVGMGWLKLDEPAVETAAAVAAPAAATAKPPAPAKAGQAGASKAKGAQTARPAKRPPSVTSTAAKREAARGQDRWGEVIVYSLILGLILFTLAYDYIINANVLALRSTSGVELFFQSFTSRVEGSERVTSFGVLWLVLFTWLIGMVVALFDTARAQFKQLSGNWLGKAALIYSGISLGLFLVLGFVHASRLAHEASVQQSSSSISLNQLATSSASHIVTYFIVALLLLVAIGMALWRIRPGSGPWLGANGWIALVAGGALTVLAVVFIFTLNVGLVRADIIYKQGQAYDKARRYAEASTLYGKAIGEEPSEDYYFLFYGRSLLQQAQQASGADREKYLQAAEQALLKAQELNPMNTDHSANLGRLYLSWSQMVTGDERAQELQKSLDYYQVATQLSPNAAHLHNEYGSAYQLAGQNDKALEQFQISLGLDQLYADTYRRLGDFYQTSNQSDLAVKTYEDGLKIAPNDVTLHSELGYLYAQLGDFDKAIEQNLSIVQRRPNDMATNRNLALLYQQQGDKQNALIYAQKALDLATKDADKADLQALIADLQSE